MKKIFSASFIFNMLLICCTKESGSISGSWTAPIDGQPQHQHGFTLKDEGQASSINLADKIYDKWEKFGNRLILFGKHANNTEKFSDTLTIVSVNDSILVLKASGGKEVTYNKTATPEKLVSDFENFDCYAYTSKKDTAFLHINTANGVVTGELTYQLFEKDRNKGSLKGKMTGDTLFGSYTFASEGQNSVREIVMVKKGNDLIEGFGEVEEVNGQIKYKDRSKLKFKNGLIFKKTGCP